MSDHDDAAREHRDDQQARRDRSTTERDARTGSSAAATRIHHQARWVDLQIERAMARGDFDNLAGAGKPLQDLGAPDDRDWWLKKLIERERITGVLPAALQLRKDDAELDALLDRETTEEPVRRLLVEFNRRVVEARRQLQGGPPVVTPTRDVEAEVVAWAERLRERRRRTPPPPAARPARRRWWQRRDAS